MKRVMCVWLPHWPLQRVCFMQPELNQRPIVLHGLDRRGGCQVVHCSPAAVALGARPGMPLAEAKALLERPGSRVAARTPYLAPHDSRSDRKLLEQLAVWCLRYSPLVGIEQTEEPSALFIDLTGCAHLFAGEETMAGQVARDFKSAGYVVRVAVADTIGSAWAVVRFVATDRRDGPRSTSASPNPVVVPPGGQSALLRDLPVEALRLPEGVIEILHELGLRLIGQLQGLARSSLPARFGPDVLRRLDQALGLVAESIVAVRLCEPIEAHWSFDEPTSNRQSLETVLRRLIGELVEALTARQEGVQQLVCRLLCAGKDPVCLTLGSVRPTVAVEHLVELVQLQLERIALAGEVLGVHVEVTTSGPLELRQQEVFGEGLNRDGERHLAILLDRLSSRLGDRSVLRARLHPDPQPEYASRLDPVLATGQRPSHVIPPPSSSDSIPDYQLLTASTARPLCLKSRPIPIDVVSAVPEGPPVRFRWQQAEHVVLHSWGPERIDTSWWRGRHGERDYYRVETTAGRQFWLFRQDKPGTWFLHGVFD